ncbi:uncharacterized protein [Procambarus clarkii]|uniref:uncharacterized protein n=1 Tax=Procambarus clarkii TaxID=6728 RepID=UPI00374234CF
MKKEDSPLSPTSSSSSSPSSSSSSTLTTMLARNWAGTRRTPLPPSDSQDLEDDLTFTESGAAAAAGSGQDDEDSLPRSPSSARSDRRMVRTPACDLETVEDRGVSHVELQRHSSGRKGRVEAQESGRWRAKENLPRFTLTLPTHHPDHDTPDPVHTSDQCPTPDDCHTPKGSRTPTGCLSPMGSQSPDGCLSPNGSQSPNGCQIPSRCQSPTGYQSPNRCQSPMGYQEPKGCQGLQYEVGPYDPHPRAFRDEALSESPSLLSPHHAMTRWSSYGSPLHLDPWDPRYPPSPDGGLPLSSVEGATMGGSVGNLLVMMERHLALQNLANNNSNDNIPNYNNNLLLANNDNNNNDEDEDASNQYSFRPRGCTINLGGCMVHQSKCPVHQQHNLLSLPGDPVWCHDTSCTSHPARLARSQTSLLIPPLPPLARSSRSQGDLFSLSRSPPMPAKRKWTTLTGLAAIGRALSASSLSLRGIKRRAPMAAATVDLGQLEGHVKCQLHQEQLVHPSRPSSHRPTWSRKLRFPEVRLGQVYATLRGRCNRAISCDSSLATNAKCDGVYRDQSPQRHRCSRCDTLPYDLR